jgi:oxalate decarboxylase
MSTQTIPQPIRESDAKGWLDLGPRDIVRDRQNPDLLVPPPTDAGTLMNMRFSFSDAHQRLQPGGWSREVTNRELPSSHAVAGVNMALEPGAYRELHWHKETEWGLMLVGNARITAIDEHGRYFIDDVVAGDLWNFEKGLPHSIQALDQGCEFLLVFSEPDFSENNTFLVTDWFAHTPQEVVAANFRKTLSEIAAFPDGEKYIFKGNVPGPLAEVTRPTPEGPVPSPFSLHMETIPAIESEAGRVRIVDVHNFPASKTISASFVEIEPGGMRELHWHPKAEEWQYYIQGKARMTVFNSSGVARTFDYTAGDVGIVPQCAGHYVQNIGDERVIYVEIFKYPEYSDISARKWLGSTPAQNVADHLNVSPEFVESLPTNDTPAPVVWFDQSKIRG